MLNKLRVRTFAKFIKIYGEEKMIRVLKREMRQQRIIYYYPDGDFMIILKQKKSLIHFGRKEINVKFFD